jgi:IclR family acetate operon transcriptional repressor
MIHSQPQGEPIRNHTIKKEFAYTVASVDRAIELLLLLESSARDLGVTELSKLLGVQKSTIHNLLQTLLARDFVRQTESGKFTLGFRLLRLGASAAERLDIRRIAGPVLRELAEVSNEYVLLAVLNRQEVTIIDSVAPQRSTFIVPRIDFAHTFHCTALGKIFLAFGGEQIRQAILAQPLTCYTAFTLHTPAEIAAEIEQIRGQGFAVSCNETIEGVTCIGAPHFQCARSLGGRRVDFERHRPLGYRQT